jgi:alpha-methylacyl-CoA racemase
VMRRLGLDFETVRGLNPKLVYCSISGYGQTGPRAQEAGHDINYQAVTGLLSLSPRMPASLTADIAGGAMPAVMNILLALRQRDLTGEGAYLDIAMADAMFTFAWYGLAEGHAGGRYPGADENMLAGGSPRYGLYRTADAQYLAVGALEQKFWDDFCDGIGLPSHLRNDRRDPSETREAVEAIVAHETGGTWRQRLGPLDCCCTIVATLEEALKDEQFRGRGLFAYQAAQGDARLPMATLPIAPAFRRDPSELRIVSAAGDGTEDVLLPAKSAAPR